MKFCSAESKWIKYLINNRRFLFPIIYLLIVITATGIVSGLLYRLLRNNELSVTRNRLLSECTQRVHLFENNMNFAVSSMKSIGGWAVLQHHYMYNRSVTFTHSDWRLFIDGSSTPDFVDQFVFMPLVKNESRLDYETRSGLGITDIELCSNPPTCTTYNLRHPRPSAEYYFPYEYYYPDFTNIPVDISFTNLDGLFIWPLQGVSAELFISVINSTKLILSSRKLLTAASPNSNSEWGIVGFIPVYHHNFIPIPGNFTHNLHGCLGVVSAIIRSNLVLTQAVNVLQPKLSISLTIDDTIDNTFITSLSYNSNPNSPVVYNEAQKVLFTIGQRNYQMTCTPADVYIDSYYSTTPVLIAVLVAVFGFVNMLTVILIVNYRENSKNNSMSQPSSNIKSQSKELAESANKNKTEFLSFLCHELRNSLHAIGAMIDFMQADTTIIMDSRPMSENYIPNHSLVESLSETVNQVSIMRSIIDDCLDLSEIENGSVRFESIQFNLFELLQSLISGFKTKANSKGLDLVLTLPNMQDNNNLFFISLDPTRLRQIIVNLLSNAIQLTNHGCVELKLVMGPQLESYLGAEHTTIDVVTSNNQIDPKINITWIGISVTDTSEGIDSNALPHLFTPYSQENLSIMRIHGGTGLRLSIVKKLVEAQHGKMQVNSILGKGSSFTIFLPVELVSAPTSAVTVVKPIDINPSFASDNNANPMNNSNKASSEFEYFSLSYALLLTKAFFLVMILYQFYSFISGCIGVAQSPITISNIYNQTDIISGENLYFSDFLSGSQCIEFAKCNAKVNTPLDCFNPYNCLSNLGCTRDINRSYYLSIAALLSGLFGILQYILFYNDSVIRVQAVGKYRLNQLTEVRKETNVSNKLNYYELLFYPFIILELPYVTCGYGKSCNFRCNGGDNACIRLFKNLFALVIFIINILVISFSSSSLKTASCSNNISESGQDLEQIRSIAIVNIVLTSISLLAMLVKAYKTCFRPFKNAVYHGTVHQENPK